MSGMLAAVADGQTPAGQQQTTTSSQTATETVETFQDGVAPPNFINLSGFSNDYQVGAGDVLRIEVVGHPEMTQSFRISNSGEISYPMIGLIRVVDLTAFEVEGLIATRLRDKQLLVQPEVLVAITEYQAKPIYVSGAVVNPGQFIMSQELAVSDAILLAGGLLPNAAAEGYLHRRTSASGTGSAPPASVVENPGVARPGTEVIKVDLAALKEGRFLESSLPLRRGDVLVVPAEQVHAFFVAGDVVEPRNYFFTPGQTVTASQAISQAKGPNATAQMSDGMLVRYDAQGNRQELKVDYAAILRGRQPDFPVLPNDIIFIPGGKLKSIAVGLVDLSSSMVSSTSFRIGRTMQLPDPEPVVRQAPVN